MNIETITVRRDVADYEKFGWKQTDTRRTGGRARRTEYILARDKDRANYRLIATLERKYFSLKAQLKTYQPIEPEIALLCFVLLVIPLFIYLGVKYHQKQEVMANNRTILEEMKKVEKEVAPLL